VTAGGDGSMISILMKAKEAGANLKDLVCCALPYGTGNDLSRVTGWGGTPSSKYYWPLKSLIQEICLNSREDTINVWDILV
jgi:diacylglycerol kinase family enzyme